MKETIQEILSTIATIWQNPDQTYTKITIDDQEFKTGDFAETPWHYSQEITSKGVPIGKIQICYSQERALAAQDLSQMQLLAKLLEHCISRLREERREWEVIIDFLMKTDPPAVFRITRKMMYYLSRNRKVGFASLMNRLWAAGDSSGPSEWCGINMPNPRQSMDALKRVQQQIFEIAHEHISRKELSNLLLVWLQEDKARPLLLASERRAISLNEITDALNHFRDIPQPDRILAVEDEISIRTNLIRRFCSDDLHFLRIAKNYIQVEDFITLIPQLVGPGHGAGKLGGKASGVYLASKILQKAMEKESKELQGVSFIRSWYLTSDTMWDLVHYNGLDEVTHIKYMDPEAIRQEQPFLMQVFKNAAFPAEVVSGLRRILREVGDKPIIVRSSSILEDNFGAVFSGKYKSLFLANRGSEEQRLDAIMDAIAEVYASIFAADPITYRKERGLLDFNEEMAILIQEVVGTQVGHYYFPVFAGVAFSHNEFHWSPRITREDGVIRIVAGLGTRAVDRVGNDYPVLISLNKPDIRINTQTDDAIQYCQQFMDVINLEKNTLETVKINDILHEYGDQYPNLHQVVSLYKDGALLQPTGIILYPKSADLVVTFSWLIQRSPFIRKIRRVLTILKEAYGTPVDVEFASDGQNLYILQCRPQCQTTQQESAPIPANLSASRKVFSASQYVTNGKVENASHIVYVNPAGYEALQTQEEMLRVGQAISELNSILPKRKFILMGPGRWGSRGDIRLGVSVQYRDINNTSLLIEIARKKGGYLPELSFGTHFFQDLVEANIHYLPLYPDDEGNIFNEDILLRSPNCLAQLCPAFQALSSVVRVIPVAEITNGGTLTVVMDGESNQALAFLVPLPPL